MQQTFLLQILLLAQHVSGTTMRIIRSSREIKCQLDATEVFIADLIACSTCFGGHQCAHHQELKIIIEWLLPVVFGAVVFLQAGHITLSSTPDQQLENHSTKYHRQQPLYNILELLMMGIVVPETC